MTTPQQVQEPDQIYDALDKTAQQFRVAYFLPQDSSNLVSVQLETVNIDDDPDFEALSYACGDTADRVPMKVNGVTVLVYRTLEAALRQFWQDKQCELKAPGPIWTKQFRIWADGICINQNDMDEKGHQVAFMGTIYRTASRVRVWLGNVSSESANAYWRFIMSAWSCEILPKFDMGSERYWAIGQDALMSMLRKEETIADFCNLLQPVAEASYWTRLWTLQELVYAKSVMIHCGNYHLHLHGVQLIRVWQKLPLFSNLIRDCVIGPANPGMTMLQILRRDEPRYQALGEQSTVATLDSIMHHTLQIGGAINIHKSTATTSLRNGVHGIRLLLSLTRQRQATDFRDCIFAMQGFLPAPLRIDIDYKLPIEQVFTRSMRTMLVETESLWLLEYACSTMSGLPSWVPDYRVPSAGTTLTDEFWVSPSLLATTSLISADDTTLTVYALEVDRIIRPLVPPRYEGSVMSKKGVRHVYNVLNATYKRCTSQSSDLAANDDFWAHPRYPGTAEFRTSLRRTLYAMLQDDETRRTTNSWEFHLQAYFTDLQREWSLIYTKSGKIGYVRSEKACPQSGDYILILPSTNTLFCARLVTDSIWTSLKRVLLTGSITNGARRAFKLISPCYVNGLMGGEYLQATEPELAGQIESKCNADHTADRTDDTIRRKRPMYDHDHPMGRLIESCFTKIDLV